MGMEGAKFTSIVKHVQVQCSMVCKSQAITHMHIAVKLCHLVREPLLPCSLHIITLGNDSLDRCARCCVNMCWVLQSG